MLLVNSYELTWLHYHLKSNHWPYFFPKVFTFLFKSYLCLDLYFYPIPGEICYNPIQQQSPIALLLDELSKIHSED